MGFDAGLRPRLHRRLIIPLLIFLIMNAIGVPMPTCLGFIFGLTAVWWLVFSVPLVKKL